MTHKTKNSSNTLATTIIPIENQKFASDIKAPIIDPIVESKGVKDFRNRIDASDLATKAPSVTIIPVENVKPFDCT